jgi:ATP-dependent Lhr-like helicase
MRWQGQPQPLSFELCQARRDVLLGDEPAVRLTARAARVLAAEREAAANIVVRGATVIDTSGPWWWTWAGSRANATVAAALPGVVDARTRHENDRLRLRGQAGDAEFRSAVEAALSAPLPLPEVDLAAIRGLKFAESLPARLAVKTLAERLADPIAAHAVLLTERRWLVNF